MRNKLLYILLIFLSFSARAQKDSISYTKKSIEMRRFSTEKLNDYKSDKAFQYKEVKKEPNWIDKVLKWLGKRFYKFLEWLFGERRASGIFSALLSSLPYIVGLIMLFLLLKIFMNVRTENILSKANIPINIRTDEEEELIRKKDIQALIDKALEDKQYRLALRYHYLYLLQNLEIKGYIQWEQQKTNHDYEREISDKNLQEQFKNLTYLYEYVWYGNFDMNQEAFDKAFELFNKMQKDVR